MWIYVVGWKGFNYPLGYYGREEEIAVIAQAHPKWIFYFGSAK